MRFAALILLTIAMLSAQPAAAEKRYALIIGNGAYTGIDPLANPPNDVRLVSDALTQVGFEVDLLVDADKRSMDKAAKAFARKLDDAGRDAIGVFYYAGHGLAYDGENWLVPVSAQITEAADIPYETLSANKVLQLMEGARNATDIMVLDSCRNNPFRGFSLSGTRSLSRGLSRMNAPVGSFIAYSTSPGDVAYDGRGKYSPFAEAFAQEIVRPSQSIGDMMIEVRKKVKETTKGLGNAPQTPWDSSSLTGRFSFNPAAPSQVPQAGAAQQAAKLETPPRESADLRYWRTVEKSEDAAEYEAYLKRYPNGEFADIARARMERYSKPAEPAPSGNLAASGGGDDSPSSEAADFCEAYRGSPSYQQCLDEFANMDQDYWDEPGGPGGGAQFPDAGRGSAGIGPPAANAVWYDDAYNQWQVTISGAQFTATSNVPGMGPITLNGTNQGYIINYTIHDATGQQIGYGQGTISDPTHIAVMSYWSNGAPMGSGQFHVNHPPN